MCSRSVDSIIPPGAGLAERRQRAHDQPGIFLLEAIRSPEPSDARKPGRNVSSMTSAVAARRRNSCAPISGFQIEGNAALGRVVVPERQAAVRMRDVVEKRPDMPAALAAGGFDLDHVGPKVAEQLAAELALFIGEFQDPQARPAGPVARSSEHLLLIGKARPLGVARTCRRRSRRAVLRGCSPAALRRSPACAGRSAARADSSTAGVSDSLNGAFCTLCVPSAGCSIGRYICRWRN